MTTPTTISFFQRFEADILAGLKTITIRDQSESHFIPGTTVDVVTFEQERHFCRVKIIAVEAIEFAQLKDTHAKQENMTLNELRTVIEQIYPGVQSLFVITFELC
jgi:uncharacterized protein YqfB (UPF0267 family)